MICITSLLVHEVEPPVPPTPHPGLIVAHDLAALWYGRKYIKMNFIHDLPIDVYFQTLNFYIFSRDVLPVAIKVFIERSRTIFDTLANELGITYGHQRNFCYFFL